MHLLIVLAVALSVGVGTTAVAEYSQPGDALYTVKANVNDRVEAAVTPLTTEVRSFFDAEADIQTEVQAEVNAEANAAGGTYLTGYEGGGDADTMDTDLDASIETDGSIDITL